MVDPVALEDETLVVEPQDDEVRPDDRIALVTYADEARVLAESRRVGDGRWLEEAIDALRAGGSTNLHGGLSR